MDNSRIIEIWVGVFVAIGIGALFLLAMQVSNLTEFRETKDGYAVNAAFQNIGSLKVRSPVKLAGVKIGRVSAIHLDNENYQAIVVMHIQPQYKLPDDSIASIYTSGLLGEQYVAIDAGGSPEYLEDGDSFDITQSALVLEELVGKFLVNMSEKSGSKKDQ